MATQVALTLASLLTGAGVASPAPEVHVLRERLLRLEAENALLEQAIAERAARTRRDADAQLAQLAAPLDSADAQGIEDGRFSFISAPTAGWDGHPFLASANGDFLLEIDGRLQLRYVLSVQDDGSGDDDTRGGFELRRVRTILSGHAFDPSLTYKVQGTFNRNGGALRLEDAYVAKAYENGVYVQIGQFRPPLTRESLVSTFRTTAVARSLAHGAIEVSRTQGVELGWEDERLSLRAAFHDGDGGANKPALAPDTEYAIAGRAELLVAGRWKQFRDFTGHPGDDAGLLLGTGVLYESGEHGAGLANRSDELRWTVDASAEFSRMHLHAMVGGRHVQADHGDDLDVLVAVVQGGVFVTGAVEAFARYEWGDEDSDRDLHLVTVGGTYFWSKHRLKWTNEVGYAFDGVSDTFASNGAGWRADGDETAGQFVFRSQFQLMF